MNIEISTPYDTILFENSPDLDIYSYPKKAASITTIELGRKTKKIRKFIPLTTQNNTILARRLKLQSV